MTNEINYTKLNKIDIIHDILLWIQKDQKLDIDDEVIDYCDEISKQLNALEIIRKKKVDVWTLGKIKTLAEYHICIDAKIFKNSKLTRSEFNLLKEVLQ